MSTPEIALDRAVAETTIRRVLNLAGIAAPTSERLARESLNALVRATRAEQQRQRWCQHCDPSHPYLVTGTCVSCDRRACDRHFTHACVVKGVTT